MGSSEATQTWWRADKWSGEPQPREFVRETEKMLFDARGNRELKATSYCWWYANKADAEDRINTIKAGQAAESRRYRQRNEAPAMEAALRKVVGPLGEFASHIMSKPEDWAVLEEIRAILARIDGGEK